MIHVLYHADCHDGFGAAWAAWRKLGDNDVRYEAVSHGGRVPPEVEPRDIAYVLDFSYPRAVLESWVRDIQSVRGPSGGLVVLDHHKAAALDLLDLPFAIFDPGKSGAVLAWEHFHPGEPVPLMLRYIQDRDLWRFEMHKSREVAAWMRSWPFDFQQWSDLAIIHDRDLSGIRSEGAAILRFQTEQVKLMADQAVALTLGGHKVHAANATCFFSEVGEELCRRYPDELFAAYWRDGANGRRTWGLRSRSSREVVAVFDCSALAKRYGGGGHPGAAGFETQRAWWGD